MDSQKSRNQDKNTDCQRVLIAELSSCVAGKVEVRGWVDKIRDQRRVQFIILRDESGADLQLLHVRQDEGDNLAEIISALPLGSFIRVVGDLRHDERVKLGGLEVEIESLRVVSSSLPSPIAADSSIDKRLDWRFLDLRQPGGNLTFRLQTTFLHALRSWWVDHGFVEINTPKLMASPSESRAELFTVAYFERTGYLAQSPQFYKQMAQAAGFGRVFEIAPVYRADPSFTSRHSTEFTSIDAEMSWIDSHEDVMRMQEELLVAAISKVCERHGEEVSKVFGIELQVPKVPFVRVTLAEAVEISSRRGHIPTRADGDLDPEAERKVGEWALAEHGHDFVFVTDYPINVRPFYHMRYENNPGLTKSYDLLWRGVEVTTGAQREHRYEVLVEQAKQKGLQLQELAYYLDFFRYGIPPHGGFGAGLARMIMVLLQMGSIRESTFLFRGPNRLVP